MPKIMVGIGGDLGERLSAKRQAIALIGEQVGEVLAVSSGYWNAALGFSSPYLFMNACVLVSTVLQPLQVLERLQGIEGEMGRIRVGTGYGSRAMDLDLLAYDEEVIELPELSVPHPRMHERAFVLVPFVEIWPEWIHPVFKQTAVELLGKCQQ